MTLAEEKDGSGQHSERGEDQGVARWVRSAIKAMLLMRKIMKTQQRNDRTAQINRGDLHLDTTYSLTFILQFFLNTPSLKVKGNSNGIQLMLLFAKRSQHNITIIHGKLYII